MAITQNITAIPKAGKRGIDTRDAFVTKQEAFQDALTDTFVTEINNFRTQANDLETNVNNKEASAIQSATIATTKASEASSSASSALDSKNASKISETNAKTSEINAKQYAESINPNEFVKKTGNETIAGIKTFSSFPVSPSSSPTADYQIANKKYVDEIYSNELTSRIGLIEYGYVPKSYHLVAFGGEFNRAYYPKLWEWLQDKSFLKTQTQWQTEATYNGGICGFYSSGNGTTTFRVPNLDKAFLRPDSRTISSYQVDEFKEHTHDNKSDYGLSNYKTNAGEYAGNWYGFNTPATIFSLLLNKGGIETRPKNIAVLPLIVAK